MNRVIQHYRLRSTVDVQGFYLGNDVKILHCSVTHPGQRDVDLWVEVDKDSQVKREKTTDFVVLWTGQEVPDGYEHVQTVVSSADLVNHIYVRVESKAHRKHGI